MAGPDQIPTLSKGAAVQTARIVWAAMLLGQVAFLFVIVALWNNESFLTDPKTGRLLFLVSLVMLIGLVPLAYFIRGQVYKKHWVDRAVTPNGYLTGNIVFLAVCEAVSFTGLASTLFYGEFWPAILPSVAAMVVQAANLPNGRAMEPDQLIFNRPRP
jgi:hypothetical protein